MLSTWRLLMDSTNTTFLIASSSICGIFKNALKSPSNVDSRRSPVTISVVYLFSALHTLLFFIPFQTELL